MFAVRFASPSYREPIQHSNNSDCLNCFSASVGQQKSCHHHVTRAVHCSYCFSKVSKLEMHRTLCRKTAPIQSNVDKSKIISEWSNLNQLPSPLMHLDLHASEPQFNSLTCQGCRRSPISTQQRKFKNEFIDLPNHEKVQSKSNRNIFIVEPESTDSDKNTDLSFMKHQFNVDQSILSHNFNAQNPEKETALDKTDVSKQFRSAKRSRLNCNISYRFIVGSWIVVGTLSSLMGFLMSIALYNKTFCNFHIMPPEFWSFYEDGNSNGSKYVVVHKGLTFQASQEQCQDLGGHLVHVNSIREQVFIEDFIVSHRKDVSVDLVGYWIGAKRLRGSHSGTCMFDQWRWVDSYGRSFGVVAGMTAFIPGKPDNYYSPEECLFMSTNHDNDETRFLKWDDAPCDLSSLGAIGAVCELPLT